MLDLLKRLFSARNSEAAMAERLRKLRAQCPVPVLWLFGKTQSGKTSIVKYLTGADKAEIGSGYRPCTRFSARYDFPTEEAPLLSFLDTRGLGEPNYDPQEDLARFNDEAHLVLVTAKALDHAQESVVNHLRALRRAQPGRPVVLALTCLHEAYPQQQHPEPYPFGEQVGNSPVSIPDDLRRTLAEQEDRFAGLVDRIVPVDLTPASEGFTDSTYGGQALRRALLDLLPAAVGQALLRLDALNHDLGDEAARQALPHILGYSTLAATAGAVPVPFVDLILLSGIQTRMVYHLARLYGQPLSGKRFLELASTLGTGILLRQAGREAIKLIPGIGTVAGSVAGGALAGASTYALGQAFCFYYRAVHKGHVPQPDELRRYYQEQLTRAEQSWQQMFKARTSTAESPA